MTKPERIICRIALLIMIMGTGYAGTVYIGNTVGYGTPGNTGLLFFAIMWIWWPFLIWLLVKTEQAIVAFERPGTDREPRESFLRRKLKERSNISAHEKSPID
jgi:hypothetical protein